MTKDNKYYFNQEPVTSDADLTNRFIEAKSKGEEINLVVSADAEAMHGRVVHVIDLAKQQGIVKLAINVQSQ